MRNGIISPSAQSHLGKKLGSSLALYDSDGERIEIEGQTGSFLPGLHGNVDENWGKEAIKHD